MRLLTKLTFIPLLMVLGTVSAAAQELASRTFLDGRVTLLIPVGFEPMAEEMLELKYPSGRRPTLVFTNPAGSVNVALNHTQNVASDADIPSLHRSMERVLRRIHPTAEWHDSKTGHRNGMHYFLLDFVTPALDTDIRNMIFATPLDGRMLLISFNCVVDLQLRWVPFGQEIIESIALVEG